MVTRLDRLGEEPALIDCPFCKECRPTRIEQQDSSQTRYASTSHPLTQLALFDTTV
jgi:hypothetical protein